MDEINQVKEAFFNGQKIHLLLSLNASSQKFFKAIYVPYEIRCIQFILQDLHNSFGPTT